MKARNEGEEESKWRLDESLWGMALMGGIKKTKKPFVGSLWSKKRPLLAMSDVTSR